MTFAHLGSACCSKAYSVRDRFGATNLYCSYDDIAFLSNAHFWECKKACVVWMLQL